jgi:PAS domain S-box-containing protein
MPLPQISLSKKLIVLLALPTAVQLGIMGGLSALEYQIDVEANRAERARLVQDSINQLIKEKYRIIAACESKSLIALGLGTPLFSDELTDLYKQLSLLKEQLKNNPNEFSIVQACEKSSLQAMAILQQLKEMHDQGDIQDRAETRPLIMHLRRVTQGIVPPELVDLAGHEGTIVERGPVVQRHLRDQARWLIAIGGLVSLLLTCALAIFLVRRVALRLEHLLDDTEGLLQQTPLKASDTSGEDDEIARLDHAIHEMAKTIGEITAKQIAVVDNAGDMVCSIDEDGKITNVNAAGGKLFGCHQADLIGKNYRDLAHRKDAGQLTDYLQRARAGVPGKPIQLRFVGKGRRGLWVVVSAQWTTNENQYFAVVHDLTHIKEAQRMKQEVVGIVSRDLATPLANLQEFLDLLDEGSIAKVETRGKRFVISARRNANQMLMFVNDMIDLEKAKNGMLTLSHEELNLDKVLDKAQVVIGPFAEEKDVVLDCRRSGLIIKGEEDKLLRVFTNLLGNAVQYAPHESSILVVSKSQDGYAQVSISDKGPGMSKEQIGTIFDAYSPTGDGEPAENGTAQGSGLGLAISKAFVELQGGTISASSKIGEGTTIAFTLPLAAISGAQKAPEA